MLPFLARNADALQALAALVSMCALVPAAVIFFLNQRDERRARRESKYIEINNQFQAFLQLALLHPRLGVTQFNRPTIDDQLSPDELLQRDILFEIFSSILERAFIVFDEEGRSFKADQWQGWLDYIREYCGRKDYIDWWRRIVGSGDWAASLVPGASQYDRRFEAFLVQHFPAQVSIEEPAVRGSAESQAPIA